jgi:anti-sigma regulatory factor (Ser/Thr protein kinase)
VPSAEGNERLALARVSSIVGELGLEPERLRRLETAVGEATMNAMEHGNRYDAERPVTVRVLTHHDRVAVQIVDQGGGRPASAPELPDLDAKLAGLQSPRGWGLFLIKNMVDDALEHVDGADHTLELVMFLEEPTENQHPAGTRPEEGADHDDQ